MIIYSKGSGYNEAAIGRYENPIKMLIESESDLAKKKGGARDWLFNVEKSNHYGESITIQRGFDTFECVEEGEGAKKDFVCETGSTFIEHLQFMKEFTITAEMLEDANIGIAADAKRRVQNFVRSYYNTINRACTAALTTATGEEVSFNGGYFNAFTPDGVPLFSSDHFWGTAEKRGTQCNYFKGDFTKKDGVYSISKLEDYIYQLSAVIRNMKDENGIPTGYVADTLVLPGNRPILEQMVKKICGSENVAGSMVNDVNLHYDNWNIVILPTWTSEYDEMLVMSSEANKALAGNLFFERVPLTVTSWVDNHTGNYNWTGRCRFGIGFGSYKHILKVTESPICTGTYEDLF